MTTTNNKHERAANVLTNAMTWLDERGIDYEHLTPYHIKIDAINFWPGRGTITIDGDDQKRLENGLVGLEAILIAAGVLADSNGKAVFRPKFVR